MAQFSSCLPEIWQAVFGHLDFETRCGVLPLVCKKWYNLTRNPSVMWRSIVIEPVISTSAHARTRPITKICSVLRWLRPRASSVEEIWLRLLDHNNHDFANEDLGRIFQMVSPNLEALHVLNCGAILSENGLLSISIMTRLKTLSIRNWGLQNQVNGQDLDNLSSLSTLTSLTLDVDINGFPCCVTKLAQLEELTLLKCRELEVPASITNLIKLKSLSIVECGLRQLSPSICKLGALEVLNLGMNQLGQNMNSLPDDILNLCALKELGLCCNEYNAIPEVVFRLTSLQVLRLSGNHFSETEEVLVPSPYSSLPFLSAMHLSCCHLTRLPNIVSHLPSLRELNLAGNNLTSLPDVLSNLQYLSCIDLHRNNFSTVPPVLARVQTLRKLNLLQNHLVHDKNTVALACLPCLEELKISGCGDSWSWSKTGWSTRSFRYFSEFVCKLSGCARPSDAEIWESSIGSAMRGILR